MDKRKIDVGSVAIGIGVGTALGVATGNLALWLGLGVAIGLLPQIIYMMRRDGS